MKRLLSLFLLSACAWATTTVTGTIQTLGTTNVTSAAFVRFWLRGCGGNQPRVAGVSVIGPTQGGVFYFDFAANGSGQVSGTLYSTRDVTGLLGGEIECGGSMTAVWYGVQIFVGGKGGPEYPVHAKNTATFDISNITPITVNPVITAPTGDSTYARIDAGNQPFTGNVTPSGNGTLNLGGTSNRWNIFANIISATGTSTLASTIIKSVDTIQYVDGVGNTTVQGAINALPTSGGTVIVPPNYTETVTSPWIIGGASKVVTLVIDKSAIITFNVTGGVDAIQLWNKSSIVSEGTNSLNNQLILSPTANISNFIANYPRTGGSILNIRGITLQGNATATMTGALLDMASVVDNSTISDTVIGQCMNGYGIRVQNTSGGSSGPINFDNVTVNCNAQTGSKPVLINAAFTNGVIGPINFIGGSLVHPGTGGLSIVDIEGGANNQVQAVNFFGTQFESSNLADIGINAVNVGGLTISGALFTAAVNAGTSCVKLSGTTQNVTINSLTNFNAWTNTIQDAINTVNITDARVANYTFLPTSPVGSTFVYGSSGLVSQQANTQVTLNKNLVLNGSTPQTGVQGTDTKLLSAGTISGTAVPLCTDANGGATTTCTGGGPIFAPQRSTTLANTAISANTQTIVITELVTFPSAAGTYRALVSYGMWATIGANLCMAEAIDTTNSRAFALTGQNANGSGFIGLAATELSPQTYAAGAVATFTLQVNCNAAVTITSGAGSNALSPGESTYLSVTPVLSN